MSIKATEISDLIRQRIENFKSATEARNVGTVVSVTDGITRIHGLADARYGEMLEFPANTFGLALNLEQDSVGAVVLGEYKHLSEGDTVKTTGRILEVPVGPELLGRVVDALGAPIDGKGPVKADAHRPDRARRPGRDLPQVGEPAGADRLQGHRLDGADRPRPARAHHRRPPDRQDRGGDRHHHQPEELPASSASTSPSDRSSPPIANVVRKLEEHGAHGAHHRRRRLRLDAGGDAVHRRLLRRARWASTSWTTARTR